MKMKEAMPGMTFGCDPELFVANSEGEFVFPEFIPGTKEEPYKVENGAVQRDGMAAEFNIDPVDNFDDWDRNITSVLDQLKKFLPSGHKLVVKPSVVFSEKEWEKAPPEAKALGCTPDFDAWTGAVNPPPDGEKVPRLRTAAGHLHFGWTEGATPDDLQHMASCRDLVKQLDWYIGPWSVRLDRDTTRRQLYGRAGAMRYKDYGVEYRVPSNFWLANPSRRKMMWNRMQSAIWGMSRLFIPEQADKYGFNDLLIRSINDSNIPEILKTKYSFPIMRI